MKRLSVNLKLNSKYRVCVCVFLSWTKITKETFIIEEVSFERPGRLPKGGGNLGILRITLGYKY